MRTLTKDAGKRLPFHRNQSYIMRVKYLTFLIVLSCFAQPPAMRPMPEVSPVKSVELRNVDFDANTGTLHYELVNQSKKAVLAIAIDEWHRMPGSTQWTKSSGRRTHFGSLRPPQDRSTRRRGEGLLEPEEIRVILDPYPRSRSGDGTQPEARRLVLMAVLFSDGSGEGDQKLLNEFLGGISSRTREAARWLPKLIAVKESPDVRAAMQRLYDEMLEATFLEEKAKFGKTDENPMDQGLSFRSALLSNLRSNGGLPEEVLPRMLERMIEGLRRDAAGLGAQQ